MLALDQVLSGGIDIVDPGFVCLKFLLKVGVFLYLPLDVGRILERRFVFITHEGSRLDLTR